METTQSLDYLIDQFRLHQQTANRAPGTVARYDSTFLLFRRFLTESDRPQSSASLTTEGVAAFTRWLRETPAKVQNGSTVRKESGIHAHLRDLRAFVHFLRERELLVADVRFTMPKLPKRLYRILTDEELARVWSCSFLAGSSSGAIRNRALIALMLDTGLRREEVANLTLDALDLERRRLTVIGKGNKERQMVFSPTVAKHLRAFLAIRGVDDEPLFHLSAAGIRTLFRRIQTELELEKFSPHVLRHQFATALIRQGENLETVGLMLGHEDYNTTRRYLSLDESDIRIAHERSSPFEQLLGSPEPVPAKRRRYSRAS